MLNPVIGTVKYLCFFCLGIYSFCYSIVMYFFPIYDMIREFRLMCMMQKRERRISMDGGLWPDRNNACKTSVLSPRSPPLTPPLPHYQLFTLLYSQPCPTTDGIYPTHMLYIMHICTLVQHQNALHHHVSLFCTAVHLSARGATS